MTIPLETVNRMKPIDLIDHPEGGRYREVYRSKQRVSTEQRQSRSAMTHIYFELRASEVSHFHRVNSDEIWNLYTGQGLYLYLWDGTQQPAITVELSARTRQFCCVVPQGVWQAAAPIEDTVLVGCSVAPGFEFEDFDMMDAASEDAKRLCLLNPELTQMIKTPAHPSPG